jgi:hypothetical protein
MIMVFFILVKYTGPGVIETGIFFARRVIAEKENNILPARKPGRSKTKGERNMGKTLVEKIFDAHVFSRICDGS